MGCSNKGKKGVRMRKRRKRNPPFFLLLLAFELEQVEDGSLDYDRKQEGSKEGDLLSERELGRENGLDPLENS